ncbi:MAG TPA: aromatic ring-hydroxylating dioxygenase subunit alpha [Burkholderiales bacterium]|jgi:vanillate O-demethylase monooxygenase subunit|nr:aromatic ring-hydroxylating dioxygenase subunit alpha [Burkholderiales bacterium]
MFVRNAWYVAAWDHELSRSMLRRIVLEEPVVLFRTTEGKAVALEDRCCHRQAPLSMGRLAGDVVTCPYHGLQFDTTGRCIKVPSQEKIPPGARVRSYPVVEKNHWIWIWTGDPAKADPALIEDFHWLDDPAWRFGGSYLHVDGNYLLVVENLLDTTHLPFLHPNTLGTDSFARSEFEVKREGDRITIARYLMDDLPAPFHKQMGGFADGMKVDRWQITHYGPPSFVKLDVGSAPVGTPVRQGERGEGVNMWNLNAITPETGKTAHYFFAQAYNFKLDEGWVADTLRTQIRNIFLEDMAIIRAQQRNMDLGPSPVQNLAQDKAWVAMRQIVQRLIQEEHQRAAAA